VTAETEGTSKGKKVGKKGWAGIISGILVFACQMAGQPIFWLPQVDSVLMSDEVGLCRQDFPPSHLVYTIDDEGRLRTEYSPAFSYTREMVEKLVFKNPLIPRGPPRTHSREDFKLVDCQCEDLDCRPENDRVRVWPTTTSFHKQTSTITLVWRSDWRPDEVRPTEPESCDSGLCTCVYNPNDYQIQYLGMVKVLVTTDTLYTIDSEGGVETSESLKVEVPTEGIPKTQYRVDFPFVVQLTERRETTVKIVIQEESHKIRVIQLPPTIPIPPMQMITPVWIYALVGAVAVVIAVVIVRKVKGRRH